MSNVLGDTMSFAFCSMTSRSARLVLSEQRKSQLLSDLLEKIEDRGIRKQVSVYAYQSLRVVVDAKEQVIKIMTENECRRLFPTVPVIEQIPAIDRKVA